MRIFKRLLLAPLAFSCCTTVTGQDFAARVDGQTISTIQVQQLLGDATATSLVGEAFYKSRAAATQALVQQAVLVQAAKKERFDQVAEVALKLAHQRRQVLAESYVAKTLDPGPRPTEAEIDRFIANNPALFEQRHTFHYHRLEVPHVYGLEAKDLNEILHLNKDVTGIAQALRRQGIVFRLRSLWLGAEQIEPELLKRLQVMGNRAIEVVDLPEKGLWVVLQRNAAFADPVDSRPVRLAIGRGLFAEQQETRLAALVQRLRSSARVEIFDQQSDIAAMVNGHSISVQQLEQQLKERALPLNVQALRKQILDRLIDQHLMAEQAQLDGLAQQPDVLQRLDQVLQTNLANQYLERKSATLAASPSEREIVQFVNARPALFAERKVFRFEETILNLPAKDNLETTRAALAGLDEVQAWRWMNETGAVIGRNSPWLGAESLSQPYMIALSEMKPGDRRVLPTRQGNAIAVLDLRSVHEDPIDPDQARIVAADILRQQARVRAGNELVNKLVSKAHIEYAPDYKPRVPVSRSSAQWSNRQWAAFSAWLAHFATLPLLVGGLSLFWFRSRQDVGFVVPMLNGEPARNNSPAALLDSVSRSVLFIALLSALILGMAAIVTLLEWNIVRGLVQKERLLAGAAGGSIVGAVLVGVLVLWTRAGPTRMQPGRWSAVLIPVTAMLAGVTLVWTVLGRGT